MCIFPVGDSLFPKAGAIPAFIQRDEANMYKRYGCTGVTLIELLVVILIAAIFQILAAPAFLSIRNSMRLTTAVNSLFASLHFARGEAIKRNARVVVCKSAVGNACAATGGWDQGWIVFHDANNNAVLDTGEALLSRENALPSPISFTGNDPVARYVSYTGMGSTRFTSGQLQMGTLTVCQPSVMSVDARQIVISSTGRSRTLRKTATRCPEL